MNSTRNQLKEKKMRFGRILAVQAFCVMPLLWAATASADIIEAPVVSKGQTYQKPTKPGKEKGVYAWEASIGIETADGSVADENCKISGIGTVIFDGVKMCAWGNLEVVGHGALCPLLDESALTDFNGAYTVNADGSITVDPMMALGGAIPAKLKFLPNRTADAGVFSCQDIPGSTGAGSPKSYLVCNGTAMKINKKVPANCP
jgi:hypothetical protein